MVEGVKADLMSAASFRECLNQALMVPVRQAPKSRNGFLTVYAIHHRPIVFFRDTSLDAIPCRIPVTFDPRKIGFLDAS